MNKEVIEFLYETWRKEKEYTFIWDTVHVRPELIGIKDKDGNYVDEYVPPTITHKFMRELPYDNRIEWHNVLKIAHSILWE